MARAHLIGIVGLLAVGLGLAGSAGAGAAAEPALERPAVVYLVRHAEQDRAAGRDPGLTDAGVARARRLASILRDEPISAVYVTDTVRSRGTAAPTLELFDLEPTQYAPMDFAALAARIRADHAGGRVLVVAHSNTVAGILRALGGPETPDLRRDEFDRMYAVVMAPGGSSSTLSLRF